ncbi:MAG TPA: Na+/H+ antiporter NhaA [Dehalococcoidia bacterium]|nr:Na+/H+ antiporter NhaA [Dehalococcoidia bacterium]
MNDETSHEDTLLRGTRQFVYRSVYLTAQAFARVEASSGIVLLVAAIVALIWANSPWHTSYLEFWHTAVHLDAHIFTIHLDLQDWVNDGLMAIFFFLAGLEIKRELVHGELSTPRRALLPAAAALGGMIAPALIYTAFNAGGSGARGWGIPMATDIAFALGVLSMLSRRVPFSVRIFLLALAIADDIGAIIVIAFFYTSQINFTALGIAALVLFGIYVMNRWGVRNLTLYVVAGAFFWIATFESGIHPTIAGVLLGLMTPASHYFDPARFESTASDLAQRFGLAHAAGDLEEQESILGQMEDLSEGTEAPLERLERKLVNWVSFLIVPLFALANAGVHISSEVANGALESPISHGATLGLVLGKPFGIMLFTFLAVRLHLCDMPAGASWRHIFGIGLLGGIGFTVSLLITDLAFTNALQADEARLGVLVGSTIAGIIGFVFLWFTGSNKETAPASAPPG